MKDGYEVRRRNHGLGQLLPKILGREMKKSELIGNYNYRQHRSRRGTKLGDNRSCIFVKRGIREINLRQNLNQPDHY